MAQFPPSQPPRPLPSSQRLAKPKLRQRFINLVTFYAQRPWILWGLAWVVMVCISSVALALIANPFFSTIPQPQRQEGIVPSVVVSNAEDTGSPLWSLGAIALLCIIGTALRPRPPRR